MNMKFKFDQSFSRAYSSLHYLSNRKNIYKNVIWQNTIRKKSKRKINRTTNYKFCSFCENE